MRALLTSFGLEEIDRLEDLAEYMDYIVAVSGKSEHYARLFERLAQLLEDNGLEEVERQLEFLDILKLIV